MRWTKLALLPVLAGAVLGGGACGASESPANAATRQAQAEVSCAGEGCPRTGSERGGCGGRDPGVRSVSRDPSECQVVFFVCNPGETAFFNACGCGCAPASP